VFTPYFWRITPSVAIPSFGLSFFQKLFSARPARAFSSWRLWTIQAQQWPFSGQTFRRQHHFFFGTFNSLFSICFRRIERNCEAVGGSLTATGGWSEQQ
jgi:hypothetical protein